MIKFGPTPSYLSSRTTADLYQPEHFQAAAAVLRRPVAHRIKLNGLKLTIASTILAMKNTSYNSILLAERCNAQAEGQYNGWLTPGFDDKCWKSAFGYNSNPTSTTMAMQSATQTPTLTPQAGTGPTFCGTAGSNAAPNPGTMAYVKPYSNQISTESAND